MVKITVGMATCGVYAGAARVFEAFRSLVDSDGAKATLHATGCLGMCYREPLVEIDDGTGRYLYGDVDEKRALSLLQKKLESWNAPPVTLAEPPEETHPLEADRTVEKKNDKTLVCKFMHNQRIGFVWARAGEKIGLIENEAMNTAGFATVNTFTAKSPELFEITFNEPLPETIVEGDALENLTWTPDVVIRNSFFGSNRARGILMTTPGKVIIEKNVFESSGSAILIAGDANGWYESGAVNDVLIRNNIFSDPCMTSMYQFCEGIISVYPEIPKPDIKKPFHRNIRIENNEFHPFDYPVLYAKSVDGLVFNGNRIIRSNRFQPFHSRKSTFTFENCMNVGIAGNTFEGEVLGKNIKLINTPLKTIKVEKKQQLVID